MDYYAPLYTGKKTFELRFDDRGYRPGDFLRLYAWKPGMQEHLKDSFCYRKVTYILHDVPEFGLKDGFVILALDRPTLAEWGSIREYEKGNHE